MATIVLSIIKVLMRRSFMIGNFEKRRLALSRTYNLNCDALQRNEEKVTVMLKLQNSMLRKLNNIMAELFSVQKLIFEEIPTNKP